MWIVFLLAAGPAAASSNPVQAENALPGDSAWRAGVDNPASTSVIEGYASTVSVAPGEALALHVRSSVSYRVEIDRLGWYAGVGGRRVACIPGCDSDRPAADQPAPPAPDEQTGKVDAGWSVTDRVPVPTSWPSGYYLAEFVVTSGDEAGRAGAYPFIVRDSPERTARILVQAPVNTWQAYNAWGGKSLYGPSDAPATKVSFDRPILLPAYRAMTWDYQLVRFLERSGYDAAYTTDVDVDRDPAELMRHTLVMSAGHDEYWTKKMRDAFEAARDAGHNLAFMGANDVFWQARYEEDARTLVEYRSATADPDPDPATKTVRFDRLEPPRPPCELLGAQYQGALLEPGMQSPDYTLVSDTLSEPWMVDTGFRDGDTVTSVVGKEMDAILPGCRVPPLTRWFHWAGDIGGRPKSADAVSYTARSGARVFSAGTLQYAWALDNYGSPATPVDERLQRFTRNMLDSLSTPRPVPTPGPPAPLPATSTPPADEPVGAPPPDRTPDSPPDIDGETPSLPPPRCSLRVDQHLAAHSAAPAYLRMTLGCGGGTAVEIDTLLRYRLAGGHLGHIAVRTVRRGPHLPSPSIVDVRLPRRALHLLARGLGLSAAVTVTLSNSSGSCTLRRTIRPLHAR
jgi:hypothetical protein